jgi:hypothetical protein
MTEPLRMTFEVSCSAEHAFSVWTARIGAWWPPDHTVSGRPEVVVLQGVVGGRVTSELPTGSSTIGVRLLSGAAVPAGLPLLEALGLAELTHEPRGNRMRAI